MSSPIRMEDPDSTGSKEGNAVGSLTMKRPYQNEVPTAEAEALARRNTRARLLPVEDGVARDRSRMTSSGLSTHGELSDVVLRSLSRSQTSFSESGDQNSEESSSQSPFASGSVFATTSSSLLHNCSDNGNRMESAASLLLHQAQMRDLLAALCTMDSHRNLTNMDALRNCNTNVTTHISHMENEAPSRTYTAVENLLALIQARSDRISSNSSTPFASLPTSNLEMRNLPSVPAISNTQFANSIRDQMLQMRLLSPVNCSISNTTRGNSELEHLDLLLASVTTMQHEQSNHTSAASPHSQLRQLLDQFSGPQNIVLSELQQMAATVPQLQQPLPIQNPQALQVMSMNSASLLATLVSHQINLNGGVAVSMLAQLEAVNCAASSAARLTPVFPSTDDHVVAAPRTKRTTLSLACDEEQLSDYQILIRRQLEVFEAEQVDVESNTQGRKKQLFLGQVGLRCIHCMAIPSRQRGRGATYYPTKLTGVYQAAQNMASSHLCESCHHIPDSLKERLRSLRVRRDTAGGGKKYWADGCRALGLYEVPAGIKIYR